MKIVKMAGPEGVLYFSTQPKAGKYIGVAQAHICQAIKRGMLVHNKYKFEYVEDIVLNVKNII